MDSASRVRVRGPLAAYSVGFREQLRGQGYADRSAQTHLLLMAEVSRWLDHVGVDVGDFTADRCHEFLGAHHAAGRRFPRSADGLVPLLEHLQGVGAMPLPGIPARTPGVELVERFGVFLARERGLAAGTIVGYQHVATLMVAALEDLGREVGSLTAADVNGFVLAQCAQRSVASAKNLVTGLRALLRFLHVDGITATSLSGAVVTVSGWNSGLPRGVDARAIEALRASCDRRTAKGRRDFAILALLTRLGIRAGEVAALELGDIDWRSGEIVVRGKGNRLERLPMPVDVGDALAGYLRRGRPRTEHPQLFVRVLAPHRRLTVGAISVAVHAACVRAGLPPIGTHRLRHTVATELLRRGAALPEIGQLLRHRSIATTSIYAKVDTVALRQLARPWPGVDHD